MGVIMKVLGILLLVIGIVGFLATSIAYIPAAFVFFVSKIGLIGISFLCIIVAFVGASMMGY